MEELKSLKDTCFNQNFKFQISNFKSAIYNLQSTIYNSRREGFTLLEIMIALVIVGITLVVIIHTVNYHADVSFGHNITTRMFLLAREKIADMEINPKNEKGMFYDKDFSYETTVRDTEEDGIVELKAIVRGYGKEVALNEFAAKKEIKNAE